MPFEVEVKSGSRVVFRSKEEFSSREAAEARVRQKKKTIAYLLKHPEGLTEKQRREANFYRNRTLTFHVVETPDPLKVE